MNLEEIRLIDLRTLCQVVEYGSLSEAARQLGESKSTISRRISRVESLLGCKLFDRSARSSQILPEGSALYPFIRQALERLDDGFATVSNRATSAAGEVRITAPVDFSQSVLPALLSGFTQQFPDISLALLPFDSHADLAGERIDIAVRVTLEDCLPDMDYRAVKLGLVTMGLYASPDRPVASCENLEQLARFKCIAPNFSHYQDSLLLIHPKLPPTTVHLRRDPITINDFASALNFASASDSYTVLPRAVARQSVKENKLVRILPEYSPTGGTMWLISRQPSSLSTRVQLCREYLSQQLGQLLASA